MTLEHKIKTSFIRKIGNAASSALSFIGKYVAIAGLGIAALTVYNCATNQEDEGCQYDTQCTTGRICVDSECVADPNYVNPNNNYEEDIQESYVDTQPETSNPCENNVYFLDADKDGFGSKTTWICEPADGFVSNDADCDDNDPNIGGPITCTYDGTGCGTFNLCANTCPLTPTEDACNNKDDNCNGQVDENKIIEYQQACSGNKVHWQDECGGIGATIETCIGTTNCDKTCVGTEVHWQNECGGIEALVETCTGTGDCSTTCVGNDVHKINECGGIEAKIETCASNEKCIDGACECQPKCYNKECGSDGCGGSCGSCDAGYECNESQNSSYCSCIPDCGSKCCGISGQKCMGNYKCIPENAVICENDYGQDIGYCSPNQVCVQGCGSETPDPGCCPPSKPYHYFIGNGSSLLCCDGCYPGWYEPGGFMYYEQAKGHCVMESEIEK